MISHYFNICKKISLLKMILKLNFGRTKKCENLIEKREEYIEFGKNQRGYKKENVELQKKVESFGNLRTLLNK